MNLTLVIDDCWNRIGVQGDLSCPKLQQFIHCRNCTVYADAAARLLDGELPDGYVDERSGHYSGQRRPDSEATGAFSIFRIGAEWLALPAAAVLEITDLRPIHPVPHRKDLVLGLVNVRGELLIGVSLARLLGIEHAPVNSVETARAGAVYPRLVVMGGEDGRLVFPVDEMHGMERFAPSALQAVPATISKAAASFTSAMLTWGERSVGCLDAGLVQYALNRGLA